MFVSLAPLDTNSEFEYFGDNEYDMNIIRIWILYVYIYSY